MVDASTPPGDVRALLERSLPRARGGWFWYAAGVFLLLVLVSTYISRTSPEMEALMRGISAGAMFLMLPVLGILTWLMARRHRLEQQQVEAIEELVQLRRWREAAGLLVHPQLVTDLLTARQDDALLVAYRDEDTTFGDEEMKVRVRCGRIVDISKTMAPDEADGENVGIARFGAGGARLLVREMEALIAAGEYTAWAPRAFRAFAARRSLHAIGTRGLPWIEIDFPSDYRRAVETVLPDIERDAPAAPGVASVLPPIARSA